MDRDGELHIHAVNGAITIADRGGSAVARLMKMLTRTGHLVEEQGMTYLADTDADHPLASLQAASCTYRIAFGPRAGQKVLSLHTVAGQDEKPRKVLCADAHDESHPHLVHHLGRRAVVFGAGGGVSGHHQAAMT